MVNEYHKHNFRWYREKHSDGKTHHWWSEKNGAMMYLGHIYYEKETKTYHAEGFNKKFKSLTDAKRAHVNHFRNVTDGWK